MSVARMSQLFFAPQRSMSIGIDRLDRFFLSLNPTVELGGFDNGPFNSIGDSFSSKEGDVILHGGGCACGDCMGGGSSKQTGGGADAPSFAVDIVPGNTSSTVNLTLGTATSGEIDTLGDHDWYRVTLVAGQTYTFTIDPTGGPIDVEDSFLRLRDAAGTQLAFDDDGGLNTFSSLTFTATSSGTYFVDVGTFNDTETGTFSVLAVNAGTNGADTVAGFTGTTGTIAIGGQANGAIDSTGDHDWYAVTLTAGQRYSFRTVATGGSDVDSVLFIRSASGAELASNDDGGGGTYSALTFTAATTGTFYLDVGGFANSDLGAYRLTADIAPPLQVYTYDQISDQLRNGYWGGAANARRFNVTSGGSLTFNVTALTAEGAALARAALELWTDFTGVTFTETAGAAQLTFDDNQTGAFASSSRVGNFITSSTINVGTAWLTTYGTALNTYSFQTYIHEIGHAIGLGHAGPYNGTADYGVDNSYLNDAWATTVMSYFDQTENTYFGGQGFTRQFVISPMVGDGVAVNTMYGTPTTTRTGNTTYGFNNNSGRAIYDATQFASVSYTVVDSGGIDTLDYSGFTQNQRIDLNAESFSNVGGRVGNVSIARGTVIENATTGSGADTLIGNAVDNVLDGGSGVSNLTGNGGNDRLILRSGAAGSTIDGGTGTDTLVINNSVTSLAAITAIEVLEFAGSADLTLTGTQFNTGLSQTSALSGLGSLTVNMDVAGNFISKLFGFAGNVSIIVNGTIGADLFKLGNGAHTVNAGDGLDQIKGGNLVDTVNGGLGVDKINGAGGADILTGGGGNDVFKYASASDSGIGVAADRITDYAIGADKLNFQRIDTNAGLAGDQGFAFVGSGAFSGGGAASIRYANSGADLLVQADVNGDGIADMEIILQGLVGGTLTAADFVL